MSNNSFYVNGGFYIWNKKSFQQDRVKKLSKELGGFLSFNEGLKILDVASGTGEFILGVSKRYPNNVYYGCDIASNVIRKNKKNKKTINWSIQDFNSEVNYKDSFFDIVIAGEIIEHLYDTDNFILEVKRVLKSKGLLFLTTPNLASWLDRITLLFGLQPFSTEVSNKSRKFGRETFYKILKLNGQSKSAGHLRCFTIGALKSLFIHYHFEIIKYIPCSTHNFWLNKLVSKVIPEMSQSVLFIVKNKRINSN